MNPKTPFLTTHIRACGAPAHPFVAMMMFERAPRRYPLLQLPLVGAFVLGHGAASAAVGPRAGASSPRSALRRLSQDRRSLVSGGKPTGGGKYPFLTIVDWNDWENGTVPDPRVRYKQKLECCAPPFSHVAEPAGLQDSTWIWCNGVMIAPDIVLTTLYCRPGTVLDCLPVDPHQFAMVG
jgi:hypothetical protein